MNKEEIISTIKAWDNERIVAEWNYYCEAMNAGHYVYENNEETMENLSRFPKSPFYSMLNNYCYIAMNSECEYYVASFSDAKAENSPIDFDALADYFYMYDDSLEDN